MAALLASSGGGCGVGEVQAGELPEVLDGGLVVSLGGGTLVTEAADVMADAVGGVDLHTPHAALGIPADPLVARGAGGRRLAPVLLHLRARDGAEVGSAAIQD